MTRLIPYSETKSYTWIAEQIKKPEAIRTIGQALAKNPLAIVVPCHRVLNINGKLGGYSGGIEMKRRLLSIEASASTR
ncbi:methylated-DNA--[protein]-cysteine S-methyltransferase [Chloroflexota bacterium]